MSQRFFRLLIRIRFPARPYYWLLDRLTDNNGWRPLGWREGWPDDELPEWMRSFPPLDQIDHEGVGKP